MPEEQQAEKKVVTSYMPEPLVEKIETFAEEEEISRSKAVAELLEDSIGDQLWGQGVKEAMNMLTREDVQAFELAISTPDGLKTTTMAHPDCGDHTERERELEDLEIALMKQRAIRAGVDFNELLEHYRRQHDAQDWTTVVEGGT